MWRSRLWVVFRLSKNVFYFLAFCWHCVLRWRICQQKVNKKRRQKAVKRQFFQKIRKKTLLQKNSLPSRKFPALRKLRAVTAIRTRKSAAAAMPIKPTARRPVWKAFVPMPVPEIPILKFLPRLPAKPWCSWLICVSLPILFPVSAWWLSPMLRYLTKSTGNISPWLP